MSGFGSGWDESEKHREKLLNTIKMWDGKKQLPKDLTIEIVSNALRDYARAEKIEVENTPEGFMKILHSCTCDCDALEDIDELDDRQMKFWAFTTIEYHIEIRRHGTGDRVGLELVKVNDKQIEAHLKLFKGEVSKEEFRRQENEARYPNLEGKKQLLEERMQYRNIEHININSESAKKILEGYEEAPIEYKKLRVAVFESVGKTIMDVAYIEKILDEKVKEMLKSGAINFKAYSNIRKITRKQQNKIREF